MPALAASPVRGGPGTSDTVCTGQEVPGAGFSWQAERSYCGFGDWVTRLALKDELLDAQLLRTVGSAPYGGADVGECLATAARLDGTDQTSWYDAWASRAEELVVLAESELTAGRTETARGAFFRASSYYRTAGVMLMAAPADERLVASNTMQTN